MNPEQDVPSGGTEEALRREIRELQARLADAQSANAAKEAFLSSMSHDIRTPMNAIIGLTALARKHIDEKARVLDALGKIETAGGHLLDLINDVLDMSRINSGRLRLAPAWFSLSDLIHDLLVMVRPQIARKEHAWHLEAEGMEQENLFGDVLRLRQIYVNLISNAVKYTPAGGKLVFRFSEEPLGNQVLLVFRCEDNGVGMTPEFLKKIYDPFERVNDSRTSQIEGTGLGMSIVRSLTEAMEGTVDIESAPGKGTAVTVRIPLRFRSGGEDFSALSGRRLLILESDPAQRELYRRYLEGSGAEAALVSSASEALSALTDASFRSEAFDLILLGKSREDTGSSLEIADYLHKAHPGLPLALAAEEDWEKIEYQASRVGIRTFLPLPFFRKSLLSALSRTLADQEDPAAPKELPDLSGRRILLVEDNEINREIAQEILRVTHAEVDTAENGREAVEKFSASPVGSYSLILMDVQMPVLDGYGATREIRASGRPDAGLPIYAMTANTFAEDVARAAAAGMNGHLAKPIDIDALMRVLSGIR